MHELSFTTEALPVPQRVDYWHGVVCATFAYLELQAPGRTGFGPGFAATLRARHCGEVDVIRVGGSAQQVIRSHRMIARDPCENLIVMVQSDGGADVEQDGRQARMRPGDCVVLDARRPYRIGLSDDFGQVVLRVPVAPLAGPRLSIPALTARPFRSDGGAGRVLTTTLEQMLAPCDATGDALAPVAIELLRLALTGDASATSDVADRPDLRQYRRACQLIRLHFGLPEFDVQALARAQGISLRQLQKAFARFDASPARCLEEARLQAARRWLRDPARGRVTIARIAADCGFADPGYFARRYRRRFGHAPGDDRRSPES